MASTLRSTLKFLAWAAVLLLCAYGIGHWLVNITYYPGAPAFDYPSPESDAEARAQDLDYFRHFLDLDKSYTPATRAQAESLIYELESDLANLEEGVFQLRIARAVAAADNGHTNIWLGGFSREHGRIPVRLYWFSDGLYVVSARPEHADLLGARVLAIGGYDFEESGSRLRQFVGGTFEAFRAYRGPILFELPVAQFAAGLIEEIDETAMSFLPRSGEPVSRSLPAQELGADSPLYWPQEYLYSGLTGTDDDTWVNLADTNKGIPLYLREHGRLFRYSALPGNGLYIQFRANDGNGIAEFQKQVRQQLHKLAPAFVVVDQRLNGGGDYTLTEDLWTELPDLLPGGSPIFVITGPATFSAGINSVAFLKAAGSDRVTLIGERVGDRARMYGETNDFILPNSGLGMTFTTGLHDLENGCPPFPACYYRNYLSDIAVGKLDPDILVETSFSDFRSGQDPVLSAIFAKLGVDD